MGRRALIPIGANKNLCGNKLREMTAYEFHCMQGHMGYFKGCIICELVPRSLRRVKVDTVLHKEHRIGYSMTMDAMVLSHRSYGGEKYAYVESTGIGTRLVVHL